MVEAENRRTLLGTLGGSLCPGMDTARYHHGTLATRCVITGEQMDKNAKSPIKWDDIKRQKGVSDTQEKARKELDEYLKGTIEPTTKK